MAYSVTIDTASHAILLFTIAAFSFSIAHALNWTSESAVATYVPVIQLALRNATNHQSQYLVEVFGSANLTTLKEILAAADLKKTGFFMPGGFCCAMFLIGLFALLGGFQHLCIALWNRPRGRMLRHPLVTMLSGFITWGMFSVLLDVSKIVLGTCSKALYRLTVAEALESWTRSGPMAVCLALMAYAAAYEGTGPSAMGAKEETVCGEGQKGEKASDKGKEDEMV